MKNWKGQKRKVDRSLRTALIMSRNSYPASPILSSSLQHPAKIVQVGETDHICYSILQLMRGHDFQPQTMPDAAQDIPGRPEDFIVVIRLQGWEVSNRFLFDSMTPN